MIHRYKLGGLCIVLDVYSGSVHVVDEVAYDIIGMFVEHSRAEIVAAMLEKYPNRPEVTEAEVLDCCDQIAQLQEMGKLFAPDTFAPMAGELKARTSGVVKALCLHVAHTCNLNCSYCFASQGKYHGDRAVMSFEVGKQALDFLIANSHGRRNLEVDFFGGEPLMNFDVVKQLVAYAREEEKKHGKNFRFTLTTNGLLIDDDVIDFANREMSNVVLSLDGRKEVHDRYRVDYAGNESWERIVPKFQKLVEARGHKNYYMRGTFTHANPDFLEDIREMLRLGFTELSMEPVVCDPSDPSALTEEDLPIVLAQYEELAELMLQRHREGKPFTLSYGYTGTELAALLEAQGLVCEFCDPDFLVLMLTPELGCDGLARAEDVLTALPRQNTVCQIPPALPVPVQACSLRQALLAPSRTLPTGDCLGKVLAQATVACPPAIPVVVCGEVIDEAAMACLTYYGIDTCRVLL